MNREGEEIEGRGERIPHNSDSTLLKLVEWTSKRQIGVISNQKQYISEYLL